MSVKDTENARIIGSLHHVQIGTTSREEDSVQVKVDMNV
jgi:hypothetical protein